MRRLTLLLTALALFAAVASADQWRDVDVQALMNEAPGRDDHPEASAVLLKLQELVEVYADGAVVSERNRLIRVLTLRGRETYSNQSFQYNTDTDVLTVVKSITVHRSGKVMEVEEDAINDVTPAFLEDATVYANVMSRVISFPLVGPGATTELQLREDSRPSADGSFSGIEYMGAEDPILSAEFTLRYPADGPEPNVAGREGFLGEVELLESRVAGEASFTIEDVPALVAEENMPSAVDLYPRVVYSSYADWSEPAAFFAGEFYPHLRTDGGIADRVERVTAGLSSEDEIVKALFLDVASGVRNIHLRLGLGGYEPNDADTVLENKYADTRDKAVLLISMLRAAGLEAYPALVAGRTDASFDEEVPALEQFSRILVALPNGGSYRFLDPFLDDAFYGFVRWGRGNAALVVTDDGTGELVRVPGFSPEENVAANTIDIDMDADGAATLRAECALTGYFDRKTRMDLKDSKPSEKEKLFDSAANVASSGATSVEYYHSDLTDLTEPVTVTQTIDAPDFAVPQGDMMIVHLPAFPHSFARTGVYPTLGERNYPFVFPCEFVSELEMKISVPDGYSVAWIPDPFAATAAGVSFELSCGMSEDGTALMWKRRVVVNERIVSTDDYPYFKDSYDALSSPKNLLVILEKA
jgi:hypothetical protein